MYVRDTTSCLSTLQNTTVHVNVMCKCIFKKKGINTELLLKLLYFKLLTILINAIVK